jgi:protein-disulfide isomerase
MASRKEQRERARQERLRREAAEAAARRRQRMVQLGVGGVLLAVIVVAAAIAISQSGGGSSGGSTDVTGAAVVRKQLAGIPQHGTVLGDPKAPVTIIELGDPQCPVCAAFSEQIASELISGPVRDGTANYDFKPWLIIGPDSRPAAQAALAAGEQRRFWNYITLFYRNQGTENSGYVTDDFMTAIAKGAGVPDQAKWDSARQGSSFDAEFASVNRQANRIGATGTPTIDVEGPNGRKVFPNVPSAAEVEAAIKAVQ